MGEEIATAATTGRERENAKGENRLGKGQLKINYGASGRMSAKP